MNFPLLYQINTRPWLHELSEHAARPITLASIPETEIRSWLDRGFTHLWFMGVWEIGPLARAHSLLHFGKHWHLDPDLAGFSDADVAGSPFAIQSYEVAKEFGGRSGLADFRARLRGHGLKLLLDFVPNHVGLDHPWLHERPEMFIQSATPGPGIFKQIAHPHAWFAHGRDPYFPAWADTAQLDYRLGSTRHEMIRVLRSIALQCDGVRCDMAMLLLNEVFAKTWHEFPADHSSPLADSGVEFWKQAIETIKAGHPEFLFMAEVYWGLEPKLQELGFDFTYDKRVYDHLLNGEHDALQRRLEETNGLTLNRGVHFLENHDEARAAKLFDFQKHVPAALLTLALPGLRLIHQGQLEGYRIHQRIQLRRRPAELPQSSIAGFYQDLLTALRQSRVGNGSPQRLCQIETQCSVVGLVWTDESGADSAIVNLSSVTVRAQFDWPFAGFRNAAILFHGNPKALPTISCSGTSLWIELEPYAAYLIRLT